MMDVLLVVDVLVLGTVMLVGLSVFFFVVVGGGDSHLDPQQLALALSTRGVVVLEVRRIIWQ